MAPHVLRIFVLALVLLVSGAPRALASVVVQGEPACTTPCNGGQGSSSHDEKNADVCTPLCSTGPCAKVFPTVPSAVFLEVELHLAPAMLLAVHGAAGNVAEGVSDDVFHPPRA